MASEYNLASIKRHYWRFGAAIASLENKQAFIARFAHIGRWFGDYVDNFFAEKAACYCIRSNDSRK
ncbi:MAG: T-protein [Sodalis sp.]|nr:MAG: T-protein [Sodalis sp.]